MNCCVFLIFLRSVSKGAGTREEGGIEERGRKLEQINSAMESIPTKINFLGEFREMNKNLWNGKGWDVMA